MKYIIVIIFLLLSINNANAEIINYENITISQYKTIRIDDLDNLHLTDKVLNYQYSVYINNSFYGYFDEKEDIFIPDNSNITIYIPSTIKTDLNKTFDIGSSIIISVVMICLFAGIVMFIIYKVYIIGKRR